MAAILGSPSWTRTNDTAVNSRVLYRLSYGGICKALNQGFVLALPIFPGRRQPSIVGRNELNYRVRNGNGWTLVLISTNYVSRVSPENIHTILFSSRFVKGFLVTRTGFEPMLTA